MKMFICSVRDAAKETFAPPFVAVSVREAARNFHAAFRQKDGMPSAHPGDFDLYLFGTFDDESADFKTGVPRLVAKGSDQSGSAVIIEEEWGGM